MNVNTCLKCGFLFFIGFVIILVVLTIYGCSRTEDDSLDKISEEVLKKDRGIDIEVRPIPKEPR